MNARQMLTTLGIGIAALGLAGCSYPGSEADAAQRVPATPPAASAEIDESTAPQPDEPIAATTGPTDDLVAETEPADADADEQDTTAVDISAESGTLYLYAQQAFSPTLQRWVVDGDELLYQELNCLGGIEADVVASLVHTGGDTYVATWQGDNPLINSADSTLQINDARIAPDFGETAVSRTEAQAEMYRSMCLDAGDALVSFIL
jgi:hypothetical protein